LQLVQGVREFLCEVLSFVLQNVAQTVAGDETDLVLDVEFICVTRVEEKFDMRYSDVDLDTFEFTCFEIGPRVGVERELSQAFLLLRVDLHGFELVCVEVVFFRVVRENLYLLGYFGLVRKELDLLETHGCSETEHDLLGVTAVFGRLPAFGVHVVS